MKNSGHPLPIGIIAKLPHFDKFGHFILLGGLSFISVLTISPYFKSSARKATFKITTVILVIITIEELSQAFIPTRTLSLADYLSGVAGVLLAAYLAHKKSDTPKSVAL